MSAKRPNAVRRAYFIIAAARFSVEYYFRWNYKIYIYSDGNEERYQIFKRG